MAILKITNPYYQSLKTEERELLNQYYARQFTSSTDQVTKLMKILEDLVNAKPDEQQSKCAELDTFGTKIAAKKLGCSQNQVRTYVHEGKLSCIRHGNKLMFTQAHIDEFLKTNSSPLKKKKQQDTKRIAEEDRFNFEAFRKQTPKNEKISIPTRKDIKKLWE